MTQKSGYTKRMRSTTMKYSEEKVDRQLGKLVWVKVGKTEHQAKLEEEIVPGMDTVLVRWDSTGNTERVSVGNVQRSLPGRRSRAVPVFYGQESNEASKKQPTNSSRPNRKTRASTGSMPNLKRKLRSRERFIFSEEVRSHIDVVSKKRVRRSLDGDIGCHAEGVSRALPLKVEAKKESDSTMKPPTSDVCKPVPLGEKESNGRVVKPKTSEQSSPSVVSSPNTTKIVESKPMFVKTMSKRKPVKTLPHSPKAFRRREASEDKTAKKERCLSSKFNGVKTSEAEPTFKVLPDAPTQGKKSMSPNSKRLSRDLTIRSGEEEKLKKPKGESIVESLSRKSSVTVDPADNGAENGESSDAEEELRRWRHERKIFFSGEKRTKNKSNTLSYLSEDDSSLPTLQSDRNSSHGMKPIQAHGDASEESTDDEAEIEKYITPNGAMKKRLIHRFERDKRLDEIPTKLPEMLTETSNSSWEALLKATMMRAPVDC